MMYYVLFLMLLLLISIIYIVINLFIYTRDLNTQIKEFFDELKELRKYYIAYSDCKKIKDKYQKLRNRYLLGKYKAKFIDMYDNLDKKREEFNSEFIKVELTKHKNYFDNMFKYKIDDDQRTAMVIDDDNNLIIASAGSGKTTTIIGKTKYLMEIKGIKPEEIITISFTNAAKDSFIEKLGNDKVHCSTFHKLGLDILNENCIKKDIARDDYLINVIKLYLNQEVQKDSEKMNRLMLFFAYHFYPEDKYEILKLGNNFEYETLKAKYKIYRKKDLKTLKNDYVKSRQELVIANFLFLNGIHYQYEPKYKYDVASKEYRQYHPDFYLEDYDIYLEHFGINKDGRAPQYEEQEEKRYLEGIIAKRKIHEKYHTKLIETYSYEFEKGIEDVLAKKLLKNGVEFKKIDQNEVLKAIMNCDTNIPYVVNLINKFIKMFKGNNNNLVMFDEFIKDANEKNNQRNSCLLEVIRDVYLYYQRKLIEDKYIDFDDMINLAADKVKKGFNHKISYIIIDEFQDTSYSRYSLIKAIQDKTHAKVVAVGDDWQSIYRFSGCDLDLFVNFHKYFPHPKYLYINYTYRNSQNLIDISSSFIMKNQKGQLKKTIHSAKENIDKPIEIALYQFDNSIDDKNENLFNTIFMAVLKLRNAGCDKIAVLGRNNADIKSLGFSPNFQAKYVDVSKKFGKGVIFSTVHKAKGLEYDGVVICNMEDYIAGFPNKIVDDSIIDYVSLVKDDYPYEEERRLFYVAITRTLTKCILVVPDYSPSIFANELMNDYYDKIVLYKPITESIEKSLTKLEENIDNVNLLSNITYMYEECKASLNRFIDVKLEDSREIDTYYCSKDFKHHNNDQVKIDTPKGIKQATIIGEPYVNYKCKENCQTIKIIN